MTGYSGILFPRLRLISEDSEKRDLRASNFIFDGLSASAPPIKPNLRRCYCQIEACLNSHPIAPLGDDPSNFSALTLSHFLVGRLSHCRKNPCSRSMLIGCHDGSSCRPCCNSFGELGQTIIYTCCKTVISGRNRDRTFGSMIWSLSKIRCF